MALFARNYKMCDDDFLVEHLHYSSSLFLSALQIIMLPILFPSPRPPYWRFQSAAFIISECNLVLASHPGRPSTTRGGKVDVRT